MRFTWMLSLALLWPGMASATGPAASLGIWRNPSNSVHVRIEPCGQKMCGVVIWANEKAKRDAAKGSSTPLVGSMLFRDFTQEKPGIWRGKLFVPDIGRTFSGTISVQDRHHIEGRGCLVGQMMCKSQVWTRLRD